MLDGVGVDWGVVYPRGSIYGLEWIRLVLSAWTEITTFMYVVCCISYHTYLTLTIPYFLFFPIKKL